MPQLREYTSTLLTVLAVVTGKACATLAVKCVDVIKAQAPTGTTRQKAIADICKIVNIRSTIAVCTSS